MTTTTTTRGYAPHSLLIEPEQESRIGSALRKRKGCIIKVRKMQDGELSPMASTKDCTRASKGTLHLTPLQVNKLNGAPPGTVVPLRFHDKHLQENLKHSGGFLPLLAAALVPLISSVAGGLIERKIAGRGLSSPAAAAGGSDDVTLVWHKDAKERDGGGKKPVTFSIHPHADGSGLYLRPWKGKILAPIGSGLYLNPYPHRRGGTLDMIKVDNHHKLGCRIPFSKAQRNAIESIIS